MLAVAAAEPPRTSGAVLSRAEPHVCAPIDANGNLTSDGTRGFQWNATNSLTQVAIGNQATEFDYNGRWLRVSRREKTSGVLVAESRMVWAGSTVAEERSAAGAVLTKRFDYAESRSSVDLLAAGDHLGAWTELTDLSGALTSRRQWDPWGRPSSGTSQGSGFAGMDEIPMSDSVLLTPFRAYDPALGRWLSDDPIGIDGGINLQGYVRNNPATFNDPLGLKIGCTEKRTTQQVTRTQCGTPACTIASMKLGSFKPCYKNESCGRYSFDATVDMSFISQYSVNPRNRSRTPGANFQQHEELHIQDYMGWCGTLGARFPSDGFGTLGECVAAQGKFLSSLGQDFNAHKKRNDQIDR